MKNYPMIYQAMHLPQHSHLSCKILSLHLKTKHSYNSKEQHWAHRQHQAMQLCFSVYKKFLLKKWEDNFLFYRKFIDNILGIWIPTTEISWHYFCYNVNNFLGLECTFSTSNVPLPFMNLII